MSDPQGGTNIQTAITTDKSGNFVRPSSSFRNTIPSEQFPAEKGRYVLYINYGCPWAHRTAIVHALKGLEDIVQLVEVDARDLQKGWYFSGQGGPDKDPLYGGKYLRELYLRVDPNYSGRITVPLLWDKKNETIVNNESAEIIRFFYDGFDELLPTEKRESSKAEAALLPKHLTKEIDELNAWVYDTVNNGVYKTGFASTQSAYEEHVKKLFESLDRLEAHLSQPEHHPYLFGKNITEADIRLFTTMIRFDVAYYILFKCNIKMIRKDYPRLHDWLRTLYWDESEKTAGGAFKNTTRFDQIKAGYAKIGGGQIVPIGPIPSVEPL